jgi:periplasmic protein TonB
MSISNHNRFRTTWLLAALVAVGMNLLLFGAMPYLARAVPAVPDYDTLVSQIQVIRLKRPETPPERKPPEPPKPSETVTPDQAPQPDRPLATRLNLPFEVAPRLPAGPGTLALPAFDLSALNMGPPGVFEAGDLDRQLVVVSRMPPVYPLNARRNGIQGWVNVRFIVNEQGRVEDVTIREADPPEVFDQSVTRCVSGWRFQPGTVDGRPVKVWAETTLHFELE